ncbi:MAG TPA: hypothetical protein VJY62_19135 [Bacteroidia bacterium]|nr:hypothetical protein [Bacteroidia bacterium]
MKFLKKLKALTVVGILASASITGIPGSAFSQTTASSETPVRFEKEKSDINKDIANIRADREKIKSLREQCKATRNDEAAHAVVKKELTKANADLRRDKAYLKADKNDLVSDYDLAIKAQKEAIEQDEFMLNATKKKLDKNLSKGNEAASQRDAIAVAQLQKELDNDKARLIRERQVKNRDIVAVNKDIKKVNGQSAIVLYTENGVSYADNWMGK